jgi:hypothetical protein
MCFNNFITIRDAGTSVSGLYIDDLPGLDSAFWNDLKTNDSPTYLEWWNKFYENAKQEFIADIKARLDKDFYQEKNLESGLTGEFTKNETSGTGLAGVLIQTTLTRYSRISIPTLKIYSDNFVTSPQAEIKIYDNINGNLLDTVFTTLNVGYNTINIYKEYNEEKLYITFDKSQVTSRKTKNWLNIKSYRVYPGNFTSVSQINGGGIVVDFNIRCKAEEVICAHMDMLKHAFYYFIGHNITTLRYLSNRANKTTIMSQERWDNLRSLYAEKYEIQVSSALKNFRLRDDPDCYECKPFVKTKYLSV